MSDLTCNYLGLTLKNPIVPSASPLSKNLDDAKKVEDAGASALVVYSLFEEEVVHHEELYTTHIADPAFEFAEMNHFFPEQQDYEDVTDNYLKHLGKLKSTLDIPIIASINGTGTGDWLNVATEIEKTGVDALEFNLYSVPTNFEASAQDVEQAYLRMFKILRSKTTLPIVIKLSDQFSSPGHFIKELESAGAQGVSLFNRFYQPDFDLETGQAYPSLELSRPNDYYRVLHWIALLHKKVNLSLCATSGVHTSEAALKLISAGADVVHSASCLLKQGPGVIQTWLDEMEQWLDTNEYESLTELKGKNSFWQLKDRSIYERINYYQNLSLYQQ